MMSNQREDVTNRYRRLMVAVMVAVVATMGSSCKEGPTQLPAPSYIEEALDSMWLETFYSVPQDSGVLVIMAQPSDTGFRLPLDARLRVRITTSAGDSEDLGFWAFRCGHRDCTAIGLTMNDGYHVKSLQGLFYSIPARLWHFSASGRTGGIRLFDPRMAQNAIALLRKQPMVAIADQSQLGFSEGSQSTLSSLVCAVPVDFGAAAVNDGIIQLAPGQAITVTYVQPDRSTLVLSAIPN